VEKILKIVIQLLEQTGCTTNAEKDDQGKRT